MRVETTATQRCSARSYISTCLDLNCDFPQSCSVDGLTAAPGPKSCPGIARRTTVRSYLAHVSPCAIVGVQDLMTRGRSRNADCARQCERADLSGGDWHVRLFGRLVGIRLAVKHRAPPHRQPLNHVSWPVDRHKTGTATSPSVQASIPVGVLEEMREVYDNLGLSMNITILKSGELLVVSSMVPRIR